jgi:hypothetical protein
MAGVLFWQSATTPLMIIAGSDPTPGPGSRTTPSRPIPVMPIEVIVLDHTPTPEPTVDPARLMAWADATSTAEADSLATVAALPGVCPTTGSTGLCVWPTEVPTPFPTATPYPMCGTPVAGEICSRV